MEYKEHDIVRCLAEFWSDQVVDGEIVRAKRKLFGGYKYLVQYKSEVERYKTVVRAVWLDEKKVLGLSASFRFQ